MSLALAVACSLRLLADQRVPRRRECDRHARGDARRASRSGGRARRGLQHARRRCWSARRWPTRSPASSPSPAANGVAVIGAGVLAAVRLERLDVVARAAVELRPRAGRRPRRRGARRRPASTRVNWGGLDGLHPVGVFGVLIALAISPVARASLSALAGRASSARLRRAGDAPRWREPVRAGAVGRCRRRSPSAMARTTPRRPMGVIAALLVASGHLDTLAVPLWVKLACARDADARHRDGRLAHRPHRSAAASSACARSTGFRARPPRPP